jgi:hypothetical protein
MNATCKHLELIGLSQCEAWTEGVAQNRIAEFGLARPAPNGAQTTERAPREIAVKPAAERRQAGVRLPGLCEEFAYALLWSKM